MNNKYKIFNEINIDDTNYEIYNLSQEDRDSLFDNLAKDIKTKKVIKQKSYEKVAIASILCLSISTVVLSNDKVWALVENIGKQIESYLGKSENEYKGYKVEVNKTVDDKGIAVSLHEVLLDDGNMLLSMNLDHSEFDESKLKKGLFRNKKMYYLSDATVYMEGKKFVETGGATSYENENDNKQDFLTSLNLERIDTNNDGRSDITNYQILENIDPNKDYDVKVVFDEIGVHKVGLIPRVIDDKFEFIKGNWEFDFRVNGKKIMGETQVYNINKEINIDEKDFKALVNIKQLRVSPISVSLTYTTKMGKEYEFENRDLMIELLDQDGNFINMGGGGGGNEEQTYMEMKYEGNLEANQKVENIKILPLQYYREKNSDNPKYHHRIEYEDKAININLK
ncbi:MAG: DUF4179 domain-containing protein [Romboutsia sp.]|uniref:DUF4179 domain-containing protein n=1 Tax=Romboutsia sp. TaxID=1965302 RepID=UPI003F3390A6